MMVQREERALEDADGGLARTGTPGTNAKLPSSPVKVASPLPHNKDQTRSNYNERDENIPWARREDQLSNDKGEKDPTTLPASVLQVYPRSTAANQQSLEGPFIPSTEDNTINNHTSDGNDLHVSYNPRKHLGWAVVLGVLIVVVAAAPSLVFVDNSTTAHTEPATSTTYPLDTTSPPSTLEPTILLSTTVDMGITTGLPANMLVASNGEHVQIALEIVSTFLGAQLLWELPTAIQVVDPSVVVPMMCTIVQELSGPNKPF